MIGVSSTRQATQPKHSRLKIATPRQSRLKRIRGGVGEVPIQVVCTCIPPCIVGLDGCFGGRRGCEAVQQKRQDYPALPTMA